MVLASMSTSDSDMDVELWGTLQQHIALENVYSKLPMRDFFQLRMVCKDWNRVACERRNFKDPVPNPYFVLITESEDDYLNGVLTYRISSAQWVWTPLQEIQHPEKQLYEPFSVEGLTFYGKSHNKYAIFDVHTKRWHHVSPAPQGTRKARALAMSVDTSVRPYAFKVIVGSCDIDTQIYYSESKKWVTKPSRLVPCKRPRLKTCLTCNGHVYIWSELKKLLVYNLEKDEWKVLQAPPQLKSDEDYRGLGVWQSHIHAVTKNEQETLSIWKLMDPSKQEWGEIERIPADMYTWLLEGRVPIITKYSGEYLLMYAWVYEHGRAYRFVLFNLARKTWEKLDLPDGKVSMQGDYDEESDYSSDPFDEIFAEIAKQPCNAHLLVNCSLKELLRSTSNT